MEEDKAKLTALIILFGLLLILLILVSILIDLSFEPVKSVDEFDNLYDCKIYFWENCGLEINDDMCYQIKGTKDGTFEYCQEVSQKVVDCWREKLEDCENKFLNINQSNGN